MTEQVVMVTGANGAIGKTIAHKLASSAGYAVFLVCRNEGKAKKAAEDIINQTGNRRVYPVVLDVADRSAIYKLAGSWNQPLHILINNAAIAPINREETPAGVERQWATNVLGYFRMIKAFEKILESSAPARVINVASYWAGGLDLTDPEFKRRRYDNDLAYRQSKQANRMLTAAFSNRLMEKGIFVNSCHPGDVNSRLSNSLGFGGHESPDEGARTPVWLATDNTGLTVSGRYFEHCRETDCPFCRDTDEIEKLYRLCESYGDR